MHYVNHTDMETILTVIGNIVKIIVCCVLFVEEWRDSYVIGRIFKKV